MKIILNTVLILFAQVSFGAEVVDGQAHCGRYDSNSLKSDAIEDAQKKCKSLFVTQNTKWEFFVESCYGPGHIEWVGRGVSASFECNLRGDNTLEITGTGGAGWDLDNGVYPDEALVLAKENASKNAETQCHGSVIRLSEFEIEQVGAGWHGGYVVTATFSCFQNIHSIKLLVN